jgi:hypothetical protein
LGAWGKRPFPSSALRKRGLDNGLCLKKIVWRSGAAIVSGGHHLSGPGATGMRKAVAFGNRQSIISLIVLYLL